MDNKSLVLDLVEWVATNPRPYSEVLDAWRTSCPRFQIWEDAVEFKFVAVYSGSGSGMLVGATPEGLAFLHTERQRS